MSEGGGGESSIIIKKVKKGHGGAHGGAWKLAYADFVTAMMAFFLLMWLLNSVTQEQLEGIANHFAPTAVSQSNSGAGDVLGGKVLSEEGAQTAESSRSSVAQDLPPPKAGEFKLLIKTVSPCSPVAKQPCTSIRNGSWKWLSASSKK